MVWVTVSMRVMSAGDGYKYLLRTVAAGDGDRWSLRRPAEQPLERRRPVRPAPEKCRFGQRQLIRCRRLALTPGLSAREERGPRGG